jgi:hypothetical protein
LRAVEVLVLSCRWAQCLQPFTREPLEIAIMSHFEIASDKRIIDTYFGSVLLEGSSSNSYLQLRVLRFGLLQDGDVGVGVFP